MIYTITANPALDRELVVRRLEMNEVLRAETMRSDCGGKGFNVSRMLAALGEPSIALGFVGGDTGNRLERGLAAAGIETDFVRIDGENRTNITVTSRDRSGCIKVNEPGPVISEKEQTALLQKITSLARRDDWWVLSGSLPPGADARLYERAVKAIQDGGGHALLDASGEALAHGCAAAPFLAKPNALEAGELTDIDVRDSQSAFEATQRMQDLGVHTAVISRGASGAVLARGNHRWFAEAPAVQVRNPIGAGDALLAGLVFGLKRGDELPQCLKMGVACGSSAAGVDGTGVPTRRDVDMLLQRVQVQSIATR